MEEKIKEKNPGLKNKKAVASQIAIGAVIFWDLSHDRIRDIEFSWNNVLDFEGRNRLYIQYTYARAKSILKKAKKVPSKADFSLLSTPEEKGLLCYWESFRLLSAMLLLITSRLLWQGRLLRFHRHSMSFIISASALQTALILS